MELLARRMWQTDLVWIISVLVFDVLLATFSDEASTTLPFLFFAELVLFSINRWYSRRCLEAHRQFLIALEKLS